MTQCGARWANNLVSLAALFGAITWFSQEGHGSEALFEVAPTAAITGLRRTGRLVTSAALILFFAFAALASSPGTDIKVIGTALAVGILIDATLVRALLVPALVSLLGKWNWWLAAGLARCCASNPLR
jgi:RND superfamily putative drug exporter